MGYPETPPDDSLTPPQHLPTSLDVLQQRYNPRIEDVAQSRPKITYGASRGSG